MRYRADPSRDPYQSSERKSLESTGEEIPYRVCRLLLHGGGDVGVGIQGESGAVVAQHGGQCFHVYSVLQCKDRECVAKLVEAENEAILVEVENGTWYNLLKGYGLRHSPFRIREILLWHEKAESTLN